MTTATTTPRWEADGFDVIDSMTGRTVATVALPHSEELNAEVEGHVRLIAAAPELVAALRKYVKWIQDDRIRSRRNETADHVIEDARALLARLDAVGGGK